MRSTAFEQILDCLSDALDERFPNLAFLPFHLEANPYNDTAFFQPRFVPLPARRSPKGEGG